jgi:lipoate---protein ligase
MRCCDFDFATPAENLACDEALLDLCEEDLEDEVLRFWEPSDYFVVLGYANRAADEVNLDFCRQAGVPVLRRCTGGGTVLQGTGCLNYSLILRFADVAGLHSISLTNQFVLDRQEKALGHVLGAKVDAQGCTDLVIGGHKFSGNAQRRRKRTLIFHGTFLLNFDIPMIEKTLRMPTKQPGYRANRSHTDFLTNLNVPAVRIKDALREAWQASEEIEKLPFERVTWLVRQKYERHDWNYKF